MENVRIDNKTVASWNEDSVPGANYVEIEPITGIMTKMNRTYTMVYSISCARNDNCPNYSQLPFPDLDKLKNKQFPIFMVSE